MNQTAAGQCCRRNLDRAAAPAARETAAVAAVRCDGALECDVGRCDPEQPATISAGAGIRTAAAAEVIWIAEIAINTIHNLLGVTKRAEAGVAATAAANAARDIPQGPPLIGAVAVNMSAEITLCAHIDPALRIDGEIADDQFEAGLPIESGRWMSQHCAIDQRKRFELHHAINCDGAAVDYHVSLAVGGTHGIEAEQNFQAIRDTIAVRVSLEWIGSVLLLLNVRQSIVVRVLIPVVDSVAIGILLQRIIAVEDFPEQTETIAREITVPIGNSVIESGDLVRVEAEREFE